MGKTNEIIFRLGEETGHIVESIDDSVIESSLFSDQYKKSLSVLEALLKQRELTPGNGRNQGQGNDRYGDDNDKRNNIISFIGDRGSGKTSCLMSFAKLLTGGLKGELSAAYPRICNVRFYQVQRIDPSFFDKTHNVIELFLAELYNEFIECRDKRHGSDSELDAQERKVLGYFAEAQKKMAEMTKPLNDDCYDVLGNLQNLSAGVQLSSVIEKLVQAFLEYAGKNDGVLVLPIDDIDLNSNMAAEMMEQIRKFLIQPNVIILLAVKFSQLRAVKELQLKQDYKGLVCGEDFIEEMAEAYLMKLMPHQQRIYMPDGMAYHSQPVVITPQKGMKDSYPSIRQMVTELIFRKTRYLFYNAPDKTSYIVPNNLRELRFLVALLYNMEDYWQEPDTERHRESNQYNKVLFRKYLYDNWVSANLEAPMQKIFQRILDIQDVEQINAVVLACLRETFTSNTGMEDCPQEVRQVMDESNMNYNIAVGDVLDVIDNLESSETDVHKLRFLFLLKTFYSMRLYQAYDAVTDGESQSEGGVYAPSELDGLNLSAYDRLVAGYYINTRLNKLIPTGSSVKETRDERVIAVDELVRLIDEVIKERGSNVRRLRLVEFFMLGISRRFDTKDESQGAKYRKSAAVFYAESLRQLRRNAYFDVGALLFNLTRIKKCYSRFRGGEDIYQIADATAGSLLNTFRLKAIAERAPKGTSAEIGNFEESYWLSWCCFRNAEIIKAFKAHMALFESPGGGVLNIMSSAFKRMGKFGIKSYDTTDDGSHYQIDFSYLSEIGELLADPEIQADFNRVFLRDGHPVPEKIDLANMLRSASKEHNRKSTRIKNILKTYPIIAENYKKEVDSVFDEFGDYMTKEEIERAIGKLNDELESYRTV